MRNSEKTKAELLQEISALNSQLLEHNQSDAIRTDYEEILKNLRFRIGLHNNIIRGILKGISANQTIDTTLRHLRSGFPGSRVLYSTIDKEGILHVIKSIQSQGSGESGFQAIDLNLAPDYLAALRSRTVMRISDTSKNKLTAPIAHMFQDRPVAAILDIPFKRTDSVLSLLSIHSSSAQDWHQSDIAMLTEIVDYLSIAIQDASEQFKRERAEQTLSQSEARYRELIERIPDGIYQSNFAGNFLAVNSALVKMLGYDNHEDLLRVDISRDLYFSPEEREQVLANFLMDQAKSHVYCLKKKDGGELWVEDHSRQVLDGHNKTLYYEGVLRDITQRMKVETELNLQRAFFQQLFENSLEAIAMMNEDNEVVAINKAFTQLFQCKADETSGKSLAEIIVPEDKRDEARAITEAALAGRVVRKETIRRRKDGELVNVSLTVFSITVMNKRVGLYRIYNDISEQRQAESALKQSEERFRDLFDNAPDMYIILDPDGVVVDFNQRGLLKLGYKRDQVVGFPITEIMVQEDKSAAHDVMYFIRQTGNPPKNIEIRMKHASGDIIWVSQEFSLLKSEHSELKAIRITCRDITESKRLEDELARSQRLETAGRVAGQIAHDFNNLLAPLTAYPALVIEDIPENEGCVKLLREMESAAIKIAEINQQLLSLGRRGHYSMEPLDLNDLIAIIVSSDQRAPQIVVEQDLNPNLFRIKGGSAQLTRAISNLILNAEEAMQHIGVVKITTDNVYLDKPLRGYLTIESGEYVKLEIADHGTGIDTEIIDKIFEPFFTTKKMDRMRGSGLGLSVVHGIIQDHKGYVTVDSKMGLGTTFSLYFPITRDPSVTREVATLTSIRGKEKILIVDDDSIQRKVASQLLKRLGYVVHAARSGEKAINYLKNNRQDLVILDMVMDGIDGAETYRKILEFQPHQKAIILSGYAMSQRVEVALKLGAECFVPKPIILHDLATTVRMVLDKDEDQATQD